MIGFLLALAVGFLIGSWLFAIVRIAQSQDSLGRNVYRLTSRPVVVEQPRERAPYFPCDLAPSHFHRLQVEEDRAVCTDCGEVLWRVRGDRS